MVYSDNIYEDIGYILRNLNRSAAQSKGTWVTGTGYGFYSTSLEKPLTMGHLYYQRFTYKFTTTNQSPTWVNYYLYGGMQGGSGKSGGLTANTEYTISGIVTPNMGAGNSPRSMTIYNGNSGAISGVTSYVKDVLVYDVTDLFYILRAKSIISNSHDSLKTWCDNNLQYVLTNTDYNITSLLGAVTNKAIFTNGAVICDEIIEPDSMTKYSCNSTVASYTFFDTGSGIYVYNNNGNGTVTHTRVAASTQNSPFTGNHPYILKITTNGSASPYAGGFYTNHVAAANKVFIEKFVAKIPVGYEVTAHYNSQGSGASVYWITPTAGTGDWEEYAVLYRCGSSGSFSTGGHIALYGSNNTSVTWYVAYVNDCDITGHEELMNYKILPSQTSIKDGKIFSGEFNNVNLMTNGDCHVQDSASLPGGWYYDTSDYAGNSTCSLVQPVGAGAGIFGPMLPVDPMNRYKVSYWVKCKGDMTSFLTAICYYTSDGSGPWTHQYINYYSGTKTTLSTALNNGDTQMTVASNSNWASRSYSRLGFRSSIYNVSYNNVGTSNGYNGSTGLIKGTSGSNIVTFNTAYSGSTIPAGTCVVESYDGGTYPYPIQKGSLPTDNTWKYVEGYFGSQEALWDGAGSWNAIPADARYVRLYLNIYSNNGSVPIKYSDMRIVPVSSENGRMEKKVSITC